MCIKKVEAMIILQNMEVMALVVWAPAKVHYLKTTITTSDTTSTVVPSRPGIQLGRDFLTSQGGLSPCEVKQTYQPHPGVRVILPL